ncbi:site-specific integrase [Sporosarcina koreensis]|uniref:site-specific integrase n=1 Tax=Sporosarcina koreensis TaxID=334735 RepID=UPI0007565D2D|nr:site-specific integrase [Sporosarcina koreensis]
MNEVQPLKSRKDIERMKSALHGRDLLLFIVGINSSLRISDILPLKVRDFDGDHIAVTEKKTGKRKIVRINNAVKDAIATLVPADAQPEDYLFPSRKGDAPISRVQAWRILNDAADRAGIDIAFGTHTLRKSFAYHAYNNGTDIALLMRVLNHSSQRETLRYIGIEQETIDDVYIAANL